MINLRLTLPPSLNQAWINLPGRGRAKSRAYKSWIKAAQWELAVQKPKPISGSYDVRIFLGVKPNKGDADNRIKAILDLLSKQKVTSDDRHMRQVTCQWTKDVEPGFARIEIEAVS